jgi:tetrapyrrole methylase family protein/MazG family protein
VGLDGAAIDPAAPDPVARLIEIVARLRGEGGCPWDRAQTRATLRPYVLEEAYEVVEALDSGDAGKIREELGDLLFQVVLHAQLSRERGEFAFEDVARTLAEKLVRRHPHVFGDAVAENSAAVEKRWEELKREERAAKGEPDASVLSGVPVALPALARAQKVQERAARVGFDWSAARDVLAKLDEERGEVERAMESGDAAAIEHEVGDLLFTVVNLARKTGVNSEDALRGAIGRFTERFRHIETAASRAGSSLKDLSLQDLDRLWDEAKRVSR